MSPDDLILSAWDGRGEDAVKDALLAALKQHILTGESLDTLLGLAPPAPGEHAPRRRVLTERRDACLVDLAVALSDSTGARLSPISGLIAEAIQAAHPSTLEIIDIGNALGQPLTTPRAVYARLRAIVDDISTELPPAFPE